MIGKIFRFFHIFLIFISNFCCAQYILKGKVSDKKNGEELPGATIKIKGTNIATATGNNGSFTIEVAKFPVTLQVKYIGYENFELKINKYTNNILKIELKEKEADLKEIEIKSSRITEKEKESPITVESMGSKQIKEAAASTFYEGLGNMKGVDITAASLGFRVVNTRGFNSTSPVRSLQLIDGVDNQSPGLNFSLGNFLGACELDLKKVDIISGASSAFYGPNAFNGVISMESKNPFESKGLTIQSKIGERQLREFCFRLAQVIKGKNGKEKLAYKVCFLGMSAYDWEANNYNPSSDSKKGLGNPGRFDAINIYGDEVTSYGNDYTDAESQRSYPGLGVIYRDGYFEKDLVDYNTHNNKFNLSIHYKITPKTELIYAFNMGGGTTVYQGENRYSLKNIRFWQNRIEWQQKDKFFIRIYTTNEDAGDSYDAVFTAMRLNDAIDNNVHWYDTYRTYWSHPMFGFKGKVKALPGYPEWYVADSISKEEWVEKKLTPFLDFYKDSLIKWHQLCLNNLNRYSYNKYSPGTERFDSMFNDIVTRKFNDRGTRFYDRSALYNIQAEYKFKTKLGEITNGISGRMYRPDSRGTIFRDTAGKKITNFEFGIYAGIDKKFNNNHWKINITTRLDKNENFNFLFSPAASILYLPLKEHNFRFTVSRAIRNPTLADQYLYYNVGRAILIGNLNGFDSLITIESIDEWRKNLDVSKIVYRKVDPISPEKVLTFELGYKAELFKSLFLDMGYYYSVYTDFIGYNIGAVAHFGLGGFPVGGIQVYRLAANSADKVNTSGFNFGFSYFFKKYSFTGNYSINTINLRNTNDPIVPAFNTPKNKFNLGFSGRECKIPFTKLKNLGFGFSYKWIEGFEFTGSPQFTGYIRNYDMFDAQLNYYFPKQFLTLKIGGSNLLGIVPLFRKNESNKLKAVFNNLNTQVYGGPFVGRLAYISILFELSYK
ncbi:MAG: TonB-dependent receptor [Bacteroidetes bacterium]|nr:TonB-dependent receptor [Bacteroidota bacterium]